MRTKKYNHNGNCYRFEYQPGNDYIAVVSDGRRVNVRCNDAARDIRFKVNSKSITAAGGARGAFEFLNGVINADFMTAWANIVIDRFN